MESLTVFSQLASLKDISQYVLQVSETAGLTPKATYKLRLAVDEIVTNIITHGYMEAQQQGHISLRAKIDEDALILSIEDTGVAYDPTKHTDEVDRDLPLGERHAGGWGVHLALWGVDELKYERDRGRNRNILIVHRHPNQFESSRDRDVAV